MNRAPSATSKRSRRRNNCFAVAALPPKIMSAALSLAPSFVGEGATPFSRFSFLSPCDIAPLYLSSPWFAHRAQCRPRSQLPVDSAHLDPSIRSPRRSLVTLKKTKRAGRRARLDVEGRPPPFRYTPPSLFLICLLCLGIAWAGTRARESSESCVMQPFPLPGQISLVAEQRNEDAYARRERAREKRDVRRPRWRATNSSQTLILPQAHITHTQNSLDDTVAVANHVPLLITKKLAPSLARARSEEQPHDRTSKTLLFLSLQARPHARCRSRPTATASRSCSRPRRRRARSWRRRARVRFREERRKGTRASSLSPPAPPSTVVTSGRTRA